MAEGGKDKGEERDHKAYVNGVVGGSHQADGVLTHTPDSPQESETRASAGPLDFEGPGPWADDTREGPEPSDLYGKFTWKIENFNEINKRELRSKVFEVGSYKWYILVYPQGCDVCNHLSLFLCVADYDKLLPGWSHFAQFTIAVVNKDPKKSKYSDTLHRFCKKEHDWGWKKFMELNKVTDGFTVANTLVIKAQVQVIHEKHHRPFRCLDSQYRRELVRVYLTNVEGICRRFIDERKERLKQLTAESGSFSSFWQSIGEGMRDQLAQDRADTIMKGLVKRFFNEKEVTSTLVMDALHAGARQLDSGDADPGSTSSSCGARALIGLSIAKNKCCLKGDAVALLDEAVSGFQLEPSDVHDKEDKEDTAKDSVDRDEHRLAELGRRTVEMYALAHLFLSRIEVAYREALALKRQEALIREEEEAEKSVSSSSGSSRSRKNRNKHRRKHNAPHNQQQDSARATNDNSNNDNANSSSGNAAARPQPSESELPTARSNESEHEQCDQGVSAAEPEDDRYQASSASSSGEGLAKEKQGDGGSQAEKAAEEGEAEEEEKQGNGENASGSATVSGEKPEHKGDEGGEAEGEEEEEEEQWKLKRRGGRRGRKRERERVLERRIEELERDLSAKSRELAQARSELANARSDISAKEQAISARDRTIAHLRQSLAQLQQKQQKQQQAPPQAKAPQAKASPAAPEQAPAQPQTRPNSGSRQPHQPHRRPARQQPQPQHEQSAATSVKSHFPPPPSSAPEYQQPLQAQPDSSSNSNAGASAENADFPHLDMIERLIDH